MPISDSGVASLNQFPINFQLMRALLIAAKVRAPFFVGTNQGILQKNAGTTSVKWERIENLTKATTPLSELSGTLSLPTRQGVVPTITPITASMLKYGNVIQLTEELELMSVNARASKFMLTLGENAGATLNEIMADVYAAATQIRFGNGVASAVLTITAMAINDIKFGVNLVNRQGGQKFQPDAFGSVNVGSTPVRAAYLGICHVDVEEDIRDITGFTDVSTYGGHTETYATEFGQVGGVRWLSTEEDSLITADEATTSAAGFRGTSDVLNDVYDSYIFAMDAIGSVGLGEQHTKEIYMTGDRLPTVQVIHVPLNNLTIADPLNEISTIAWKSWMVGKVLQDDWVVRVRTLASDLA